MPPYYLALTLALLASSPAAAQGYLEPSELPGLQVWLAPSPPRGSVREAADLDEYMAARAELDTPRGSEAIADNVYDPADVILRFNEALGFRLDRGNAPCLIALMDRVMRDEEAMLHPVKRGPCARGGGAFGPTSVSSRCRPARTSATTSSGTFAASGAYPSGRAMLG